MSTRLKEKVVAAIRRLFRSADKTGNDVTDGDEGGTSAAGGGNEAFSPSRRSLPAKHGHFRHYNDHLCHHPHHYRKSGKEIYNCYLRSTGKDAGNAAQGKSSVCPEQRAVRPRRLMKELCEIQRWQNSQDDAAFTAELVNDNLYEWHVRLRRIDPESELAGDMRELGIPHILLHVIFPENFPFAPPFMRVVSPRIERGFVMEGGAICMELLTPRGWASAYTVEAVITQFAASIVKGQGRVARKGKTSKEFTRRSAEESFRSLVKTHEKYGWVTPPLADG